MDRIEIETKLNRDRAWLLEAYASLAADDLARDVTPSEHDSSIGWSALDHLVHLAGIERNFNAMIRRHFDGDTNPVGLARTNDGAPRSRDEIMTQVHRLNEEWVAQHRGKVLAGVVALGQDARAETLALLANLSDSQLLEKIPGAPWGDGSVGGVIAINADHGRMHWKWIKDADEAGVQT